jgi:hypothetical protein
MSANPLPSKRPACCKEAQRIKGKVDSLISKMHKETKFMPTRDELEEHAELLIDLINNHHSDKFLRWLQLCNGLPF